MGGAVGGGRGGGQWASGERAVSGKVWMDGRAGGRVGTIDRWMGGWMDQFPPAFFRRAQLGHGAVQVEFIAKI